MRAVKVKVTELLGTWREDNHKRPASSIIRRKNRVINSVEALAIFSREHYIFVNTQENSGKSRRSNNLCTNFWIGEKLLWIDMDKELDAKDVVNRLRKKNITGFVYYTSSYYFKREKRVRIGILTKQKLRLDGQTFYYARQLLHKLGYKDSVLEGVDPSIYKPSSYLAPVLVKKDGKFVRPFVGRADIFCSKGKPFKFLKQKAALEKIQRIGDAKEQVKVTRQGCFGELGEMALKLLSYDKVRSAVARNNSTISLTFRDIKEKTIGGYYISANDPCILRHPNPKKKLRYLDEVIGQNDFLQFKEFLFTKRFYPENLLKGEVQPDIEINNNNPYLDVGVFKPLENYSMFLESPTGTGKTKVVSEFMKTLPGKSILFISNNRTQAAQLYRALQKEELGFECYISIEKSDPTIKKNKRLYKKSFIEKIYQGIVPDRLICGVLSLHHLIVGRSLLKTYDFVIIDEITNTPNYTVNMVPLLYDVYERYYEDMLALSLLLKRSNRVVCMDGYISKFVKEAICNISEKKFLFIRKNYRTNKRVELFVTNRLNEPNLAGTPTCKKFIANFDKDVEEVNPVEGKPIIVCPHSTKKQTEEAENYVKHKFPSKKTWKITGAPSKTNKLEKVADLDMYLQENNIAVLFHSPAITTGVDIPQAQGANVYHTMSGDHLNSHVHYQMTMRGRNANSYKILVPTHLFVRKGDPCPAKDVFTTTIKELVETSLKAVRSLNEGDGFLYLRTKYQGKGRTKKLRGIDYKMSSYLLFMRLVKNKNLTRKKILRTIEKGQLLHKFKDEGLRCAIELEMAAREWEAQDKRYGILGNYINLLAIEGCIISKERDYPGSPPRSLIPSNRYREGALHANKLLIEEVLGYEFEKGVDSIERSYAQVNKLKCAQRVLHYLLYNYQISPKATQKTAPLLKKALKKLGIGLETTKKEVSNTKLLKLYNYIMSRNFRAIEREVQKILYIAGHRTDRKKISRMTLFLKLFFRVEAEMGKKVFSSNKSLLISVKDLADPKKSGAHIRALYVKQDKDGYLINSSTN